MRALWGQDEELLRKKTSELPFKRQRARDFVRLALFFPFSFFLPSFELDTFIGPFFSLLIKKVYSLLFCSW
jgi:hypothetical protein